MAGSFFVYIVESPSPSDFLQNRMEGPALKSMLDLCKIEADYNVVINSETFSKALGVRLISAINRRKKMPIIHLSCHGDQAGIQLTSMQNIDWKELKETFRGMNNTLNSQLTICLSCCEGFGAARMALTSDNQLPFETLIAHNGCPSWSDAAIAFAAFYHRLRNGANTNEACEAMKSASGDNEFAIYRAAEVKQKWLDFKKKDVRKTVVAGLRDNGVARTNRSKTKEISVRHDR